MDRWIDGSMTWRDYCSHAATVALKMLMSHVIRNEKPNYYDPESSLATYFKGLSEALIGQ